jgi:hypothetical protein
MAAHRITKEKIREVVQEVLGRIIVEYDTACHDVISKSEFDGLVDKLYEACNGRPR